MKKFLRAVVVLAMFFSCLTYLATDYFLPYVLLQPRKVQFASTPDDLNLKGASVQVFSKDSLLLKGYCILPKEEKIKAAMILVHGVGACKEPFLDLAGSLAEKGIVSYVFDSRAHGESGGAFCTYGFYEKHDISQIVSLIQKEHADVPIGIWGNSMGGAIAIQALEYDKRIDFGVVESTFTSLRQIAYDYKKRMLFGVGIRFMSDRAVNKAGEIADFIPDDVSPINAVKNIKQAVFIAHGDADRNISWEYGKELYKGLASKEKEFYLVKGGRHFGLAESGGLDYTNKLWGFIKVQIEK